MSHVMTPFAHKHCRNKIKSSIYLEGATNNAQSFKDDPSDFWKFLPNHKCQPHIRKSDDHPFGTMNVCAFMAVHAIVVSYFFKPKCRTK